MEPFLGISRSARLLPLSAFISFCGARHRPPDRRHPHLRSFLRRSPLLRLFFRRTVEKRCSFSGQSALLRRPFFPSFLHASAIPRRSTIMMDDKNFIPSREQTSTGVIYITVITRYTVISLRCKICKFPYQRLILVDRCTLERIPVRDTELNRLKRGRSISKL